MTPPAVPWPPRPPRRVAGIPAGLLVGWQAAVLLALVAIGRPAGTVLGLGLLAAAAVAVTGWRPGGRWVHEWLLLWLRYQLRAGREPAPGQPPPLLLLDLAAGVEGVEDMEIEGEAVALIAHRHGYAAVLELAGAGDPAADLHRLPLLLAEPAEPGAPAVSVQLLVYAPGAGRAARTWLAVQARRAAGRPAGELRAALAGAVRRLRRRLRTEQREALPLDRSGLLRALPAVTGLELAAPPLRETGPIGTERWSTWWTRTVPHRTVAVRSWPGLPGPPDRTLLAGLLGSGAPVTVSLAAQRRQLGPAHGALGAGTDVLAMELLVRLAGPDPAGLAAVTGQVTGQLAAAGARIERLDGRQLPGLAGTLPLGGFLPGYRPVAAAFPPPPKRVRAPAGAVPPAPAGPLVPASPTAPEAGAAPAGPVRAGFGSPPIPIPLPAPEPVAAPELVKQAACTGPPPARGQARIPTAAADPAGPAPARGQAPVPARGQAPVRAFGAGLFTAESPDRAQLEQLLALARTPQPAPQVISVVAGRAGLGATGTAAAVARTLATVRDDHTALLGGPAGPVDGATIDQVRREHAFTVVDLGAHPGEETPVALDASTRVLVVTGVDRRATAATRVLLERLHLVHPSLARTAVIAVVCRSRAQFRRVSRELRSDPSPQAAQIVPVPEDPAMHRVDHVDLTRLRTTTREAYLRLAAALALPQPVAATAGARSLAYLPTNP